jgi:predicted DNA binding protein
MVVIADITIAAGAFPLGRVLEEYPDIEIEIERIVPLHDTVIPLCWISGGDTDSIKSTLEEDTYTNSVSELTSANDRTLFEIRWSAEINGVVNALIESKAKILEAIGTADSWDFRLRFLTHEDLSRFNHMVTDEDISVTLRHLYNPTVPDEQPSLSSEQEEAVKMAFEHGYFEVPRGSTAADLATEIGISDSAFSQRLRRGLSVVVADRLSDDNQPL